MSTKIIRINRNFHDGYQNRKIMWDKQKNESIKKDHIKTQNILHNALNKNKHCLPWIIMNDLYNNRHIEPVLNINDKYVLTLDNKKIKIENCQLISDIWDQVLFVFVCLMNDMCLHISILIYVFCV